MYIFILLIAIVIVLMLFLFMQQTQFGKTPTGARLEAIQHSKNYRDGQFQNLHPTPQLTDGATMFSIMKEFFFGDKKRRKPAQNLPSQKTNLHALEPDKNMLVWFGHSSYFIRVDGKNMLVDPVFSGNAAPIKGTNKSFPGTDVYTADDFPEIDVLFITHDHWDHS